VEPCRQGSTSSSRPQDDSLPVHGVLPPKPPAIAPIKDGVVLVASGAEESVDAADLLVWAVAVEHYTAAAWNLAVAALERADQKRCRARKVSGGKLGGLAQIHEDHSLAGFSEPLNIVSANRHDGRDTA